MTPAEIFAKHGLHNAADLARAAETAGLSYSIAAALAEKESGGRNIYGHDAGGVLSTKRGPVTLEGIVYPRGGDIPVTYENFTQHFLPAVLGGAVSNGVGPLQITYPGYFTQRPSYPWWDPYMSAVVGYTDFVTYLKGGQDAAAIEAAGSRYNSGSYTKVARTYGADLATLVAKWDTWLKASTPEEPMTDQQYTKAMSTLGNVTPNTRKKALAVLRHCQETLGRAPGVLWGFGSSSEHVSGRAIDFMVTQHGMGVDTEMGNVIAEFVLAHGLDWGLGWVIWRQRIYPASGTYLENPNGGWRTMEDRGSTTQNHMDHPHVYFATDTYSNGASVVPDPSKPALPANFPLPFPLPAGHYYGNIAGPERSHGGYYAAEQPAVKALQQALVIAGCVPGITNPASGWADGKYEQPTVDAAIRFQKKYRPNSTTRWGELWADDVDTLRHLFA